MISGFGVELLAIDAWEVGTILSGLQIQANTQLMMHLLFFYPTSQTKSSVDVLFRTIANTRDIYYSAERGSASFNLFEVFSLSEYSGVVWIVARIGKWICAGLYRGGQLG